MRRFLRCIGLFLLLVAFVLPVSGANDKKDDKKDKKDDTKKVDADVKEREDWVSVGQYQGKVKSVQGAQKAFTLEVTMVVPNQAAYNRLAELKVATAQAAGRKDFNAVRNYNNEAARLQMTKEEKKDVQLVSTDDVVVRVSEPPVEFNDKGDKKRYTKEELKKLAGPGGLWGFPAEFDQVQTGMTVRAILSRKKADRNAPKTKKKDDDGPAGNEPVVTQVHIMYENKPMDKK